MLYQPSQELFMGFVCKSADAVDCKMACPN